MSTRRVLLIDPDPASAALIARGFSALGVDVRAVGSVAAGREWLKREVPDVLIVTDRSEGLAGLDALRAAQGLAPDLPLVFMSTFVAPRTRRRALQLGAAAVVDQPFDLEELFEVSSRWLDLDEFGAHAS